MEANALNQFRSLADYVINYERKKRRSQSQAAVQIIQGYETETRKPENILDDKIRGRLDDKQVFLNLATKRAEKLKHLTSVIDNDPSFEKKKVTVEYIWTKVKNTLRNLKYFFIDLKDKSTENLDKLAQQLVAIIDYTCRQLSMNCNATHPPETCDLDKLCSKGKGRKVFANSNFMINPNETRVSTKREVLANAIDNINLIAHKHLSEGLRQPKQLIKNLVDMSVIEAELDFSAKKLAAMMTRSRLLDLADYVINYERNRRGLPAAQVVKGYEEIKDRDPNLIINDVIKDPSKTKHKSTFIELANKRAAKLREISSVIDIQPDAEMVRGIWGAVKNVVRELKFFLRDLKDQSIENIRTFSEKLVAALNQSRSSFQPGDDSLTYSLRSLDEPTEVQAVLNTEYFATSDQTVNRSAKFSRAVEYLNSIMLKHLEPKYSKASPLNPDSLVRNLVDMSNIENEMYACITKLAA